MCVFGLKSTTKNNSYTFYIEGIVPENNYITITITRFTYMATGCIEEHHLVIVGHRQIE